MDQPISPVSPVFTPTPVIPEPSKKSYRWLIVALIIFLLAATSVFAYKYWQLKQQVTQTQPSSSPAAALPSPAGPESLVMDMKVYRSATLGFMIRYPSGIQVTKELNDQYNRFTSFAGNGLTFEVRLKQDIDNTSLDQYYFMDAPISGQTTLGGLQANIYQLPNGYCDGPSCSQPFVAVVTKRGNDFFSLSFYGDPELSEAEKTILVSFQFIE